MWSWEQEPRSVAEGILDDETYDWAAVVAGMLATDGTPVLVSEESLRAANDLAREAPGSPWTTPGPRGSPGCSAVAARGAAQR